MKASHAMIEAGLILIRKAASHCKGEYVALGYKGLSQMGDTFSAAACSGRDCISQRNGAGSRSPWML